MSDLLKAVIQDLINDRSEQAQVSIHQYIVGKTQQIAGLNEANDKLTIELDIADWSNEDRSDAETDAAMEKFAKKHNATVELVKRIGPGGGWPIYAFTGAEADLRKLFREYNGGGENADADFDEFL